MCVVVIALGLRSSLGFLEIVVDVGEDGAEAGEDGVDLGVGCFVQCASQGLAG